MPVTTTQLFYVDYRYGIFNELTKEQAFGEFQFGPFSESYVAQVDHAARLPNYRQLISQGECATTLLHVEEEHCSFSSTDVSVVKETSSGTERLRYYLRGQWLNEGKPPPGLPEYSVDVENRALSNFYSNLAAIESRFKGLVFTGELRESLTMIRHPARALRRAVSEYLSDVKRRGPRLPRRRRPSFVRETWLEWSFGVKPLISDIDGAIKAFYASQAVHPIFEMARGLAEWHEDSNRTQISYGPAYNSRIKGYRVVTDEVIVKLYGTYKSSGSGVTNLHKYGFSPWEFVPTIWELIPYSFLADYFTNIGKILESWSYRNLGPRFMSKTYVLERRKELQGLTLVPSPDEDGYKITTTGYPGSFSSYRRLIHREPNVGLPIPSLTVKVPGNWTQWCNIAALTKQLDGTRRALQR